MTPHEILDFCRQRVRHRLRLQPADEDDLVGELCVAVLQQLPAFDERRGLKLRTFLRSRVEGRIIDWNRVRTRYRCAQRVITAPLSPHTASPLAGPPELAQRAEDVARVQAAVSRLPQPHAERVQRIITETATSSAYRARRALAIELQRTPHAARPVQVDG